MHRLLTFQSENDLNFGMGNGALVELSSGTQRYSKDKKGATSAQGYRTIESINAPKNRSARRRVVAQTRAEGGGVLQLRRLSDLVEVKVKSIFPVVADFEIRGPMPDLTGGRETPALVQTALFTQDDTQWAVARAAVDQWMRLEEGWDGDNAQCIAEAVLDAAISFIGAGERYAISEPSPYINSDGEIGLNWEGERAASVSFLPTDRFLALCPRSGKLDLRISGPLDIAVCSRSLFDSLQEIFPTNVDHS